MSIFISSWFPFLKLTYYLHLFDTLAFISILCCSSKVKPTLLHAVHSNTYPNSAICTLNVVLCIFLQGAGVASVDLSARLPASWIGLKWRRATCPPWLAQAVHAIEKSHLPDSLLASSMWRGLEKEAWVLTLVMLYSLFTLRTSARITFRSEARKSISFSSKPESQVMQSSAIFYLSSQLCNQSDL